MGFDVGSVDHKPLEIRLVDQLLQQLFPDAFVAPAAETAMGIFPITVIRRQVAPGCPGAQDPENCVEKSAVILRNTTPLALLPGKMNRKQFPGRIAQIVTVVGGQWRSHLDSFAYPISS